MAGIDRPTKDKDFTYSDFTTRLSPHPAQKDIVRLYDAQAVSTSIRNLLQTNRGERLYQPNIGSDIRKILFEPMSDIAAKSLQLYIHETIEQYEPRIKIVDTMVIANYASDGYDITIYYVLINNSTKYSLNITLNRAR